VSWGVEGVYKSMHADRKNLGSPPKDVSGPGRTGLGHNGEGK
jgi:hypothetical protein